VENFRNEEETNVVIATFSRENLDKVNWDHLLTENIFVIADQKHSWIHPDFFSAVI